MVMVVKNVFSLKSEMFYGNNFQLQRGRERESE
jgi:hypothetical protein